jgi:hypothetical protein
MGKQGKKRAVPEVGLTDRAYEAMLADVIRTHRLKDRGELFAHERRSELVRARADLYLRLARAGMTDTEISRLSGFTRQTVTWTLDRVWVPEKPKARRAP